MPGNEDSKSKQPNQKHQGKGTYAVNGLLLLQQGAVEHKLSQHEGNDDKGDPGGVPPVPGLELLWGIKAEARIYDELNHPYQNKKAKIQQESYSVQSAYFSTRVPSGYLAKRPLSRS